MKVVFEDDCLLVIDKPAGLVSTPAETTQGRETLADILERDYGISLDRGGLVHRLDKNTSGLILAAKTPETFEALQEQFKDREVKKEYLALVHGIVKDPIRVEGSIARNPLNREKFAVFEDGKEAATNFDPVKNLLLSGDSLEKIFPDYSKIQIRKLNTLHYSLFTLVKCFPETGRTHQIRVHLKHIQHPIVSDEKYVGRKMNRLDKRWCSRMFLHAARVTFKHPKSGAMMELESPLPEDLSQALANLK